MILVNSLIACVLVFGSAQMPSTTDWRGLSPLRSTRMDVERILGPPYQEIENAQITYRFSDMEVYFFFSSNPKCRQKLPYTSWNVTSDTVTGIYVILSRGRPVADTGIDLTKYKKIEVGGDLLDQYAYLNADESFVIEVGGDNLRGYNYQPGTKHEKLRCEPVKRTN